MTSPLDPLVGAFAELAVRVGVNVQPSQRLWVSAPLEAAPLVREVARVAYCRRARLVEVIWHDDQVTLARFRHAPRDSFAECSPWRGEALSRAAEAGDAFLSIFAEDPDLLSEQDPALVAQSKTAEHTQLRRFHDRLMSDHVNWSAISVPIPSWAARVFPGLEPAEQVARLGQAIVHVTRLDTPDPIAAWLEHTTTIGRRAAALNDQCFRALHYRGPGTDLTVGLPDGHRWLAGTATTSSGISFVPNMPTEEVFTLPHRDRVDGLVRASMPLAYAGTRIEGFGFELRQGRVIRSWARQGEETLRGLLEMDEGASRLGEVALVPASSVVAETGLLFHNTLFDENAACHLALGKAYCPCLAGGSDRSDVELAAAGVNDSLTHVDFMIGSPALDVDGLTAAGSRIPVMRRGEWAL